MPAPANTTFTSSPLVWASAASASARFTAVVDLPTPPFPLATATMFLTPGTSFTPRCTACEMMRVVTFTVTRPAPGSAPIACCTSLRTLSCWLRGAADLTDELKKRTGLAPGETDAEKRFSVSEVECIGLCEVAPALFVNDDLRQARALAGEKARFRSIETQAADTHLQKIKSGEVDAAEVGALYLDILRDMKGINSHLVGAAAYPLLARHGELLPSRLREAGN